MTVLTSYLLLCIGLGLNYILNIFIGRSLGPSGFGDYALALNFYNIAAIITVFGLDQAALKFIPQTSNPKRVASSILHISLIIAAASTTILFFILLTIFHEKSLLYILFLTAVAPTALLTQILAIAQAHQIFVSRMVIRYLCEPALRAMLIISLFNSWGKQPAAAAAAFLFSYMVTLIISVYRYRAIIVPAVRKKSGISLTTIASFAFPIALGNLMSTIGSRIDILILGALVTSGMLGVYTASLQTAAVLAIVLQGIELVYASKLSASIGANNAEKLEYEYQLSLRVTVLIGTPIVVFFSFYSEMMATLFGEAFSESRYVLCILCISQFINLATGSANQLIILFGYTRVVLIINTCFLITAAVLIYCGSALYEIIGAAIGILISSSCLNFARVLFVGLKKGIYPYDKRSLFFLTGILTMLTLRLYYDVSLGLSESLYLA
ncbi:MAG: oligosaccharide flippase family protein, partial [Pseudomonadales bacterium]|nr:oligosaccharide flippase family protein [Pseudomonadales bacterium]